MRHTEDIIQRLLRIRKAAALSESPSMSEDDIQKLRDFIIENRRQIPPFALSHFDRLEASGKRGIAHIEGKKCSACGAEIADDEIEYLVKNKNIGVCDNCFAFIYMPDDQYKDDGFFNRLLGK